MRNSYPTGGFPGANFEGRLQEALDELRSRFEKPSATRAGRGEVRAAVLSLLAERPMHGYQIIREIEERTDGSWKPSPGSVYPTLQLLADEGFVSTEESEERKIYSLTDAGREEVEASGASTPWAPSAPETGSRFAALPKAGMELAQAAAQVGRSGSQEQVKEAVAVLEEARRRLYSILAQG